MSVTKIKTVTKGDQSSTAANHPMVEGITCNGYNNFKIFAAPCCGNCHKTNRNRCCTSWSQVKEILCVNELILIGMGANRWLTRNCDSCTPQCPCYYRPDGSVGRPLRQGALKLSRAAPEKGRQQESQYSQRTLKGYTGPPVDFSVRTGTIWIFRGYVYLCVCRIPHFKS